jgi:zinc D-Ala-D-Ala carboxypeptidase
VRSEKQKSSINLLAAARKKHRRDRWLVSVLILVSVLVLGYSLVEAKQAQRVESVIQPTIRPGPQVAGVGGVGGDGQPNAEKTEEAQASPPPAPEQSCDDLRVLVDQSHPLPPDYVPEDLVSLWAYGVPTLGGDALLRREAAEHLGRMVNGAAASGEELVVASAYRSYADQQVSHARLTSIYGTHAGEMSATPGHSQHQLGTAVDFTNAAAGYEVWQPFGDTSAYWWLRNHAREYGFVLAYPSGKEAETGYQWEPWHYRYVGVKNAERLEESGLSLQEFLLREGVLPRC